MSDHKKLHLSSLATLDEVVEAVSEVLRQGVTGEVVLQALDEGRLFPAEVRSEVDQLRSLRGQAGSELRGRAIHRLVSVLGGERTWEVRSARELGTRETGEREYQVELLGLAAPDVGVELIPIVREDAKTFEGPPTDFCECAHVRGSHNQDTGCELCGCSHFRLLGPGMARLNVEEMPSDPGAPEDLALSFLEALLAEPSPSDYMALQRLISAGWRITAPPE